ncbi:MAG: TRAP transporter small permease subunit [Butyricicoccus sp.]|nr:TRAP transporter small permease subunit [Butyricicoccus sp.]
MKLLKRAYDILTKFEEVMCSIAFLLLAIGIVCDIISRKITGNSISWLEESSRMIFISITMITASVAVTTDEHPRMNAVLTAIGAKRSSYLIVFTDMLCAVFFLFMLRYAFQSAVNMYTFGTAYTTIPFKVWHTYIFFPLSFAGLSVRHIVRAIIGVQKIRLGEVIERGEEQ